MLSRLRIYAFNKFMINDEIIASTSYFVRGIAEVPNNCVLGPNTKNSGRLARQSVCKGITPRFLST